MKIDRTSKPLPTDTSSRVSKPAQAGSTPASAATPQVHLSGASQVRAMAQSLDHVSVVDSARVESIKQAIAGGNYSIHPEAIADGLMQSVRDLLKG